MLLMMLFYSLDNVYKIRWFPRSAAFADHAFEKMEDFGFLFKVK